MGRCLNENESITPMGLFAETARRDSISDCPGHQCGCFCEVGLDPFPRTHLDSWVSEIGQNPSEYGTHSMRWTKASLIYQRTKNLRAVQLLLGRADRDLIGQQL
jgi:hypothetical protein